MDDLEILHLLNRAHGLYRRIYAAEFDMVSNDTVLASKGYGKLLSRLDRQGPKTPGELADILEVRPQSLTTALNNLEKRGYIIRQQSQTDRRQQLISITEAGSQQSRQLQKIRIAATARLFGHLDDSQKEQLGQLLKIVNEAGQ